MLDMLRPGGAVPLLPAKAEPVPGDIKKRMDRGRQAMRRDAAKRRLCMRFERGDTYHYLDSKGLLNAQPTTTAIGGGGKPEHRIRNKYNMIRPIVEDKVSTATQRIPSYTCSPSSADEDKIAAARLSEKIAVYGYDKWRLRQMSIRVAKLAIAHGGEGFAMPYFDANVGPYDIGADGEMEGRGEIRWITLNGNQVYWEPGTVYEQSRWWAIERARPVDEVSTEFHTIVTADATTSDIPSDNRDLENLVTVSEYFERPCANYPQGRWMVVANGKQLCPERTYPLTNADGEALDEPLLHRLVYTVDPDTDRDLGLVWQLIDAQRTIQDCWNKLLEWKNRCLNPQILAQVNSLIDRPDDVPGAVKYYRGTVKPEWETPPPVPSALFDMLGLMKQDMRDMSAYEDVQAQARLAAATVDAVLQQSQARWGSFLGDLAEFHSRFMRHCLLLVAQYYDEERLVKIRGMTGWESIPAFKGSDLLSEVDVIVQPDSLRYKSRDELRQEIYAMADRMWISPQQAMAAIDNGTAEKLVESYQLDVAKSNRIIQRIRNGTVMDMPTRHDQGPDGLPLMDPATGMPAEVPTYMPDVQDNKEVWISVFGDWMKTDEYESLDPAMQAVSKQIFTGIKHMQAQEAQQAAEAQAAQAEALGMQNATRPSGAKPLPNMPGATTSSPA